MMRTADAEAIAVMRGQSLLGVLTAGDVLGWVADGGSTARTVKEIMGGPPPSVAPQTLVSDLFYDLFMSLTNVWSEINCTPLFD